MNNREKFFPFIAHLHYTHARSRLVVELYLGFLEDIGKYDDKIRSEIEDTTFEMFGYRD